MKFIVNNKENEITFMKTGCIVINGREAGQWKRNYDGLYEGFLFEDPEDFYTHLSVRRLSRAMQYAFTNSIYINK